MPPVRGWRRISRARRRLRSAVTTLVVSDSVLATCCRNLHLEPLLRSLETPRVAFPAWVLAYKYRDELYRVVISGQDDGCVRGKAPLSLAKVLLVVGLVLTGGLLSLLFASLAAQT